MAFHHILPESKSTKTISISKESLSKLGCHACPLDKAKLDTPKMKPAGAERPEIYFLADHPTEKDDEAGEVLSDGTSAGNMVRSRIPSRWKGKIRWNAVVRCAPGKAPSNLEIECCRKLQVEDIVRSKPKAVVGFGFEPLRWMIQEGDLRNVWRGRRIAMSLEWEGKRHSFWFYPMLSPGDAIRLDNAKAYRSTDWSDVFNRDLARVFRDADAGFPEAKVWTKEEMGADIQIWKPNDDPGKWVKLIQTFTRKRTVGFDLETTGLLPYPKHSKVLTASFSDGDETIAFPIGHREAAFNTIRRVRFWSAMRGALLAAKRVVAHNLPFEIEWLLVASPWADVQEVIHKVTWGDSLAQAYTMDERKGAHGLEDVTLINLGINIKTAFEMSKYLDKAGLDNEPLENVLFYNGVDSKGCVLGWKAQREALKELGLLDVSRMHERRAESMARLMSRGLLPDLDVAEKFNNEYLERIAELTDEIMAMPEVKRFRGNKPFNPNTPKDVLEVLRLMDMEVDDTQDETLAAIDHPFPQSVRDLRTITTLQTRYTGPLVEGRYIQDDGRIHARFSGTRTSTGRLASEDPNMQNFPKRENRQIRGTIRAPKKHYIAAFDMGQLEFRVGAMCSRDKKIVDACWTDFDVHGHWLEKIVEAYPRWSKCRAKDLKDKDKRKKGRDHVKNEWVFPGIFDARLKSRAGYLGIPEKILAPLDEEFWDDYRGVKEWHQRTYDFYAKHGYVQTLTGRRRHWGVGGPMSPNAKINMPIQGTGYDLVAEPMERLDAMAVERDEPWLGPVIQIHDDLTFYIPVFEDAHGRPSESKLWDACELIGKTMCLSPYEFVNVPLVVEMTIGKSHWDKMDLYEHVYRSTDYGHKRDK
jgi:DNA polymerase I-like protein with 3'-5' exonuclease and polymerase domains/uracil-DNA glycosylase